MRGFRASIKPAVAVMLGIACFAGTARADGPRLVDHPDASWWLSADLDAILMTQPGFHSPKAGAHSFSADDHVAGSFLTTVFAGYSPTSTTAIVVSGESTAGEALGDGRGLDAPLDDDLVRNPSLGAVPYIGQAFIEQVIPLTDNREPVVRTAVDLLQSEPSVRIEIRAGRLWAADLFETDRSSFRDVTIRHDGAWDSPADERGFAFGAVVDYIAPLWQLRFAELALPTTPRGGSYDLELSNAHGEAAQLTVHDCLYGHAGSIAIFGYMNHAPMGSYGDAVAAVTIGQDETPDVTKYRLAGRNKRGVGLRIDQAITGDIHGFVGAGWSDGDTESFGPTEIDNTVRMGVELNGSIWRRPSDGAGLGLATSGLSDVHRTYLALGGIATVLGDGSLHDGRQTLVEGYYRLRVVRGVDAGVQVDLIEHPGFNVDRGPAIVGSLRVSARL